ncbi:MAG: hypothetical protein DWQ31_12785 [Planctomycetota bacterium]|nr:MAG: hypothetical protein DWQ31_12785 [Planctomycetota bacterium]REJ95651.1 MAG: hypothetical protein DWQ35_06035 [Planctomycetota bacterium]REK29162.1 MAG: hypothetical protein DWQ42_03870 [Planctomycetota bacterium]REK46952.1 MAG: hypothetical protein DWQ46_05520 [Planctomycetota bacterium]
MKNRDRQTWVYLPHLVAVIALASLAMALYAGTYEHPFAFDDNNAVVDNPKVQIREVTWENLRKAAQSRPDGRRPLAFISLALNHAYEGLGSTFSYHLVNNLIHAVTGVLVYALALLTYRQAQELDEGRPVPLTTFRSCGMAIFAAALFVAHPVQTQAVTYIVQRMTSMATMFYVAALLLYILGRRRPWGAGRVLLWLGVPVAFLLAYWSKRIAFPLPFVIPLYELFFFQDLRFAWLKRPQVLAALAVVLLAATGLVIWAMALPGDETKWNPLERLEKGYGQRDFTMAERLYTQPRVVMHYLTLLAWPTPDRLNLLYHFPTSRSLLDPPTSLASLGVILSLIAVAIYGARRQRVLSFAVLWFFIHLALESTILPLEMIYEHRLYLPMVGVAIGFSYVLWTLLWRHPAWATVASCLLVALLSAATVERNTHWADIYEDVIEKNPRPLRALLGRGLAGIKAYERTRDEEHLESAVKDFEEIIELNPSARKSRPGVEPAVYDRHVLDAYVARSEAKGILGFPAEEVLDGYAEVEAIDPTYARIYGSRGNYLARSRRFEAAIEQYTEALERRAERRRKELGQDADTGQAPGETYFSRGFCYEQINQPEKALLDYDRAVAKNPYLGKAYLHRANLLHQQGDAAGALADIEQVLRLNRRDFRALFLRAQIAHEQDRLRDAKRDLTWVIQLNNRHEAAKFALVQLLLSPDRRVRDVPYALQMATLRCRATRNKDYRWLELLARAQASSGRLDQAIATLDKAIDVAPQEAVEALRLRRAEFAQAQRRGTPPGARGGTGARGRTGAGS